jgi:hypothetical protein
MAEKGNPIQQGTYLNTPAPSAYSTMSDIIGANRYGSNAANDPYIKFLASGTDPIAQAQTFQDLYRGLVNQAAPAGSKAGTMFEYVQSLLRSTGLSKGTSPLGIPDNGDITGMQNAIKYTIATNSTDTLTFLNALSGAGGLGGKQVLQQPDTTTKYNKQISTALQYKDLGDAKAALSDAYFSAWGVQASADLISSFGNAWNAEVKSQTKATTTETVTSFEKVIDPKTGKQKRDKSGILQYKPITKQKTSSAGEGFTAEEQNQFLADYISTNFNIKGADPQTLGGASKAAYDQIAQIYKNNYLDVPKFATVAPIISQLIGTADANTAKTILDKQYADIRKTNATKYMSIADYLNQGEDANKYIDPLRTTLSASLETDVNLKDPLMIQLLNFQGSDGKYRMPNEWEITQAITNDPRYLYTSKSKNDAVNLTQSLKNGLQI